MLGSTIKVVATAENGNTFESDATEEVGEYEALTLISAEQTGKDKVKVTFSAPATSDDKLTVKKGSVEQTFTEAFDDATFTSKTLTFKNNLTTGTYTVTLTPADKDVDPSSVEFEAKSATKAATIEVTNKYLVMKDTNFKEGYFFIKGYNGIGEENDGKGEEITPLTGLTVNVAPSDANGVSYDAATGKVTVKYTNPGFAVIKNVSVFAQYTGANGEIITCQDNLEVTTIGYPSEVEFGDIKKEGSTESFDSLKIADLGSNKCYVELNKVKDQYGNDLSANDLNDLASKDKGLITVIPSDGSPVFFGTNPTPFSEVNGKVVVFLTRGNGMPGPGTLMISGAGGTFSKDITITDNSYIKTLNVDVPDLYQGERTDDFAFSAIDEYEEDLGLYPYAPTDGGNGVLDFADINNQTGQHTKIQASDEGQWIVTKDTEKKTFTVKYLPKAQAKSLVTFTIITAGMNTRVISRTVGSRGAAGQVMAQTSAFGLTDGGKVNLNEKVSFKDANGKEMVRTDCYPTYPSFLADPTAFTPVTTIKDEDIDSFYWCVTETKMKDDTRYAGNYDKDGVIFGNKWNDNGNGVVDNGEVAVNNAGALVVTDVNPTPTYYVTLLGKDGGQYKVLDSKPFRFTFTPVSNSKITYSVVPVTDTLYAGEKSDHSLKVKIKATNVAGEEWDAPLTQGATSLVEMVADKGFTTDANEIKGALSSDPGDGEVTVKVFYDDTLTGTPALNKPLDTIKIKYSDDDPVATGVKVKLTTTTRMGGPADVDGNFTADTALRRFTTTNASNMTMADGLLTIDNVNGFGDTLTAWIVDQYGRQMKDTKVELNGIEVGKYIEADPTGKVDHRIVDEANFVLTNGSQKIDLTLELGDDVTLNKPAVTKDAKRTVKTETELVKALKDEIPAITLGDSIEVKRDITVPANVELVVPADYVLDTGKKKVTIEASGKITVNGVWNADGGEMFNDGTVEGSGTADFVNCKLNKTTTAGDWNLEGTDTLVLTDCTIAAGKFAGHVEINGTLEIANAITLEKDVLFDMSNVKEYSDVTGWDKLDGSTVDADATVVFPGATEDDELTAEDIAAITEFLNAYSDLLALDPEGTIEWTDDMIASLEAALAAYDETTGEEGDLTETQKSQLTDALDALTALSEIQYVAERIAIDDVTPADGFGVEAEASTNTSTSFKIPEAITARTEIDLEGAAYTAKVGSGTEGSSESLPTADAQGVITISGLASVTADTDVVITITTVLGNEIVITVDTEGAVATTYAIADNAEVTSGTKSTNALISCKDQYNQNCAFTAQSTAAMTIGEDHGTTNNTAEIAWDAEGKVTMTVTKSAADKVNAQDDTFTFAIEATGQTITATCKTACTDTSSSVDDTTSVWTLSIAATATETTGD